LRKRQSLPKSQSSNSHYRGRFAPSPTGPLHFGSLVAALGSYLDAKHHRGKWLVRIEDLDTPRTVKHAVDEILRTLEAHTLHWDEEIVYQSRRAAAYDQALLRLKDTGTVYPCCCSRKEIADSALHGIDGQIYPGTCRMGIPDGRENRSWRVRTDQYPHSGKDDGIVKFDDILQGSIELQLENEIGDFVIKRSDGLIAYQLAVVVDDAFQGITHVVRGSDLLYSTPRQIYLQQLLGLPTPAYMHLPIAVNSKGDKLSKQTLAPPATIDNAVMTLLQALDFLRQQPPAELHQGSVEEIMRWAVQNWRPERLKNCRQLAAKLNEGLPHG